MLFSYNDIALKYGNDYQINKAIRSDEIFKIIPGIYSDTPAVSELELVSYRYSSAVFTMDSAFFYHNLTDDVPDKYYLATEKDAYKIKDIRIKQCFHRGELFKIGISTLNWQGVQLKIYDEERMLIELIRNKHSLPFDYYKEIIANYRKRAVSLDIEKIQQYLTGFQLQNSIFNAIQLEVF